MQGRPAQRNEVILLNLEGSPLQWNKIKSPEPVRVRDWISFVQSQAVAGLDNAHVAAA